MVAFNARRLVCSEISFIVSVTLPIASAATPSSSTLSTAAFACSTAFIVISLAFPVLIVISLMVVVISSAAAAIIFALPEASAIALEALSILVFISPAATATLLVFSATWAVPSAISPDTFNNVDDAFFSVLTSPTISFIVC